MFWRFNLLLRLPNIAIINFVTIIIGKCWAQIHHVLLRCLLQHLGNSILMVIWIQRLQPMWSCQSMVTTMEVFVSLFIIIWLILIYFRMGSVQLYRLQKCPHLVVFFSINRVIKFLLEEIIVFLLSYCFVLFCESMEILFSFFG